MITGFLFWSQLLRTEGRPSWVLLYTGRLFRIGPLYLLAITVMMITVSVLTGFHLQVPASSLGKEVVQWLGLGALPSPPLNGYRGTGLLLVDVMWTLRWEWGFYLCLPALALVNKRRGTDLWFVLGAMVGAQSIILVGKGESLRLANFAMLFLFGMLSGSLRHRGLLVKPTHRTGSALLVVLVITVFQFRSPTNGLVGQLLLGTIFYLVVSGVSIFGLLTSRAAVRLGDISFGIYLLQGLLLGAVLRWPSSVRLDRSSALGHWLLTLLSLILLISVATVTHLCGSNALG